MIKTCGECEFYTITQKCANMRSMNYDKGMRVDGYCNFYKDPMSSFYREAMEEDEEVDFQYEEDLRIELNELLNEVAADIIKPNHYQAGGFDVISFCQIHNIGFELGNVIKYVTRAGKKENNSELQDLTKALEFLNRRIEFVKGKGE